MQISRADVFDIFLGLEEKYSLWDQATSDGIYFWKLIRFPLFESVITALGLSENSDEERADSRRKRFSVRDNLNSLYLFGRGANVIVLENPRKVKSAVGYIDPYTAPVVEDLRAAGIRFILAEDDAYGHLDPSIKGRRYVGNSLFEKLIARRIKRLAGSIEAESEGLLQMVLEDLSTRIGKSVSYKGMPKRIVRFKAQRKYWIHVFHRTRCERIYLVCSYGKEGLIDAARTAGVLVYEVQHGTIYKYHPGYSFPRKNVPYFPDRILCFGRKWCGPFFPLEPEQCEALGYRYLNAAIAPYRGTVKRDRVVFLSQWAINERMLAYAKELHAVDPGLDLVFKFHPRESAAVVDRARSENPGITFVKNEVPLYDMLAEASVAVGVFSTATLESLALGCRLVLLRAPGIEALDDLITDLSIPVAESPAELPRVLAQGAWPATDAGRLDGWLHGCVGRQGCCGD